MVQGSPRPGVGTIFFACKAHLQRGVEPLGRVGLLGWDHGWVSSCLIHSRLWALSAWATPGAQQEDTPEPKPAAAAIPLGSG